MQYVSFNGSIFSKLTLGTAQLGMSYGISNKEGKPTLEHSLTILTAANRLGINTVDTARSYGESEAKIGAFIEKHTDPISLNIITKFKISSKNLSSGDRAWEEIRASLRQSLAMTKRQRFSVCLFHCSADQSLERVLEILPALLQRIKDEGWTDITGISMYDSRSAGLLSEIEEVEAVQVPTNIFDHHFMREYAAPPSSKLVFARSVFLQGLFFMAPAELNGNLTAAGPYLLQLQSLAARAGMSIAQLAFAFVRDQPLVDSMVIGVEEIEQLRQNVDLLKTPPIPDPILKEIERSFAHIDKVIIRPGEWHYKKI